jgi:hypothetical protein
VQKKERDRVLHENVLDVQDPCFLGNSSFTRVGMPAAQCEGAAKKIKAGRIEKGGVAPCEDVVFS